MLHSHWCLLSLEENLDRGSLKINNQQSLKMFPFFNLKKVDQASEYAVSEAFSLQKSRYPLGPCGPVTSLETVEELQDHDEAHEEGELKYCLPQAA